MSAIWHNDGGIKDCFRINQNTLPKAFADCQAQNKKLLDHDSDIAQINADSKSDVELREHIIDKIIDAKTNAVNKSSISLSSLQGGSPYKSYMVGGFAVVVLVLFLWWKYKGNEQKSSITK